MSPGLLARGASERYAPANFNSRHLSVLIATELTAASYANAPPASSRSNGSGPYVLPTGGRDRARREPRTRRRFGTPHGIWRGADLLRPGGVNVRVVEKSKRVGGKSKRKKEKKG